MSAPLPPLYAIVDAGVAARHGLAVPDLAAAFLDGGATLLQLRGGSVPTAALVAWADAMVALASRYDAAVVVNDRADVARMSGAAGVHLGQDDLSVDEARAIVGPDALIGLSTHTPTELDDAWGLAVGYLAVGPVYATVTKATGYRPVGLELVAAAAARRPARPIVAIGGITLDRAPAVRAAGATSVAVIGDLVAGGRPAERVRAYVTRLSK